MSTLAEIEAAAADLSPEQKQELFIFLAARLRDGAEQLPSPRPEKFVGQLKTSSRRNPCPPLHRLESALEVSAHAMLKFQS